MQRTGQLLGQNPVDHPLTRHLRGVRESLAHNHDVEVTFPARSRAGVDGPAIRARYTALVRRLHPDANGGDRAGETRLQRVIKAYQTLKKAGLV